MNYGNPRLIPLAGSLGFSFPFNKDLITDFKARVPWGNRRWDDSRKLWLVTPDQGPVCQALVLQYYGVTLTLPASVQTALPETRLLEVWYLGTVKDRGPDNEPSAYGYDGSNWVYTFPESVLRNWFDPLGSWKRPAGKEKPKQEEPQTFYVLLACRPTATPDEVRSAYRRMARQWHPDVCQEVDAAERFREIQAAWDVLSEPKKRKKYDFGLQLEAESRQRNPEPMGYTRSVDPVYRSPLRSGFILATGTWALTQFVVSEILEWSDIVDRQGKTLVSSWPFGAKSPRLEWR